MIQPLCLQEIAQKLLTFECRDEAISSEMFACLHCVAIDHVMVETKLEHKIRKLAEIKLTTRMIPNE